MPVFDKNLFIKFKKKWIKIKRFNFHYPAKLNLKTYSATTTMIIIFVILIDCY